MKMNLPLFLIIIIALIIIFLILYNGLRILLSVEKEKGMVNYEFKVTMLKIAIFKREGTKGIIESIKGSNEDKETEDEGSKSQKKGKKDKEEDEEDKGLKEKIDDIKPILKELKKSKDELKGFLKNILKAINIKRLEGNLILGLDDNSTTIKIARWNWSIGAIVNDEKKTSLTVDPRFKENIIDFEGKVELKLNLLILLIYTLILLSKKNIRELIKELYRQKKAKDESKNKSKDESKETDSTNEK